MRPCEMRDGPAGSGTTPQIEIPLHSQLRLGGPAPG
jgi:hypothetical protein